MDMFVCPFRTFNPFQMPNMTTLVVIGKSGEREFEGVESQAGEERGIKGT
jgi:hypothetical protein